jgi:hypothetical protein
MILAHNLKVSGSPAADIAYDVRRFFSKIGLKFFPSIPTCRSHKSMSSILLM